MFHKRAWEWLTGTSPAFEEACYRIQLQHRLRPFMAAFSASSRAMHEFTWATSEALQRVQPVLVRFSETVEEQQRAILRAFAQWK